MGTGGLMDGTTRLSRDGEPVYHYSFLSTFADACVVPEKLVRRDPEGHSVRRGRPRRVRGDDRGRGRVEHGRRSARRSGRDHRVWRCRPLGADGGGGRGRRARSRRRRDARQAGRREGLRRHRLPSSGPVLPRRRRRPFARLTGGGVDYAIEATGRPEAMTAAFLSTRARGAAVLIGIPREDAVLNLLRCRSPRMERRILGSIYGSSRPSATSPTNPRCIPPRAAAARSARLAPPPARRGGARLRADASPARLSASSST